MDLERRSAEQSLENRKRVQRTLAYIGLAIAGMLGLWRVETTARNASDLARAFAASEEREDAEERAERVESCKIRNTFQMNSREGDAAIVEAFRHVFLLGASTPEEEARINELAELAKQEILAGRSPEAEDRDCDGDGELTPKDYSPEYSSKARTP